MMNVIVRQAPTGYLQQTVPEVVQENSAVHFSQLASRLWQGKWLILAMVLAASLAGALYGVLRPPVYEASVLIQVEQEGQKEAKNILGEMGALFDLKSAANSEVELIQSRLVITKAIGMLNLQVESTPRYFPLIGKNIAALNKNLTMPGSFGFGAYAWGGEKALVAAFDVPAEQLNHEFVLTALDAGTYRLDDDQGHLVAKGQAGSWLRAATRQGPMELLVSELAARPGVQFLLKRRSLAALTEEVQKNLDVHENGKQSGVIAIKLKGNDGHRVYRILTAISAVYMGQNFARKTEEASKTLAALETKLPDLKADLEQSELRYSTFRKANLSVDVAEEAKLSVQQAAAVKIRRLELVQKREELLARFTPNHPLVIAVDAQLENINTEIKQAAVQIKTLPAIEQETARLAREVKVNNDLYTALLNTAQQLRLVTLGKMSNVRLVDPPVMPEQPLASKLPALVSFAALIGLCLGTFITLLRSAARANVEDLGEVEKIMGVPIYGAIPHSAAQKKLLNDMGRRSPRLPLLSDIYSMDEALEALRTFRTILQFSMAKERNNIVMMTSPTEGVGKSFICANLASLSAAAGKKVLLIDADLRNGQLHRYFNVVQDGGLTEAITGTASTEQIIHRNVMDNLDLITTGSGVDHPSELLARSQLGKLLESVTAHYDLILIDGTPVLPVPDMLIMGAHAGAIYLLIRPQLNTAAEISETCRRLNHAGLRAKGVLVNDVDARNQQYRYGYGYGYGQRNGIHPERVAANAEVVRALYRHHPGPMPGTPRW